jgi:hypothetical protein
VGKFCLANLLLLLRFWAFLSSQPGEFKNTSKGVLGKKPMSKTFYNKPQAKKRKEKNAVVSPLKFCRVFGLFSTRKNPTNPKNPRFLLRFATRRVQNHN